MPKEKATKETELGILIPFEFRRDFTYGTQAFKFTLVTIDSAQRVRNPSDTGEWPAFTDLTFRSQASADMNEGKPYGYECEYYDTGNIDLRRAERMVALLKRIEKAKDKFAVRPETFGQYVQMVAKALGVTQVVVDKDNGRWHTETEHQFWTVDNAQWLIDRKIGEFLDVNREAMAMSKRY